MLKTLADHDGLTLTELGTVTGMSLTTAHRLLATLAAKDLATVDEASQKWSIGIEAFRIGAAFQRKTSVISAGRAVMQELMEATGETINLAIRDRFEVVFVSQVECHEPIRAFFSVGQRRAIHASGIGKALLAYMPEDRVTAWLRSTPLARFTRNTIIEAGPLQADLARIRQRGWALDDEEANSGMRCIAAPLFNAFGEATGGLSLSGPTTRITTDRFSSLGEQVCAAAQQITALTGGGLLS